MQCAKFCRAVGLFCRCCKYPEVVIVPTPKVKSPPTLTGPLTSRSKAPGVLLMPTRLLVLSKVTKFVVPSAFATVSRTFAEAGPMSYGPNFTDVFRQAGTAGQRMTRRLFDIGQTCDF
jgi:hypothetical protein